VGPLEELYASYARFMEQRQDGRGGSYVMSRQELWEMVRTPAPRASTSSQELWEMVRTPAPRASTSSHV
jgi:hypothetical protein